MKIIATHSANFHTDDVFGTAALLLYLEQKGEKAKVIRTFEPEVWQKADYILDIGRVYDPKKNLFDHHQGGAGERPNGIPYASFGLIWKKYGKALAGSQRAADMIDEEMISFIDADDNGVTTYTSILPDIKIFTISEYVGMEADAIKSIDHADRVAAHKAYDKKFRELVEWAKGVIRSAVTKSKEKLKFEKEAIKAYESAPDKRVIVLKRFLPYSFSDFQEPLLMVYPDLRTEGVWCAKNIRIKNEPLKGRFYFPESWRGKTGAELEQATGIKGATFCHLSGFLVCASSKEAVLELVQKAFKILKM